MDAKVLSNKYSPFDLRSLPNFKGEKNRAMTTGGQRNTILYCLKSRTNGCSFALCVVKVTETKEGTSPVHGHIHFHGVVQLRKLNKKSESQVLDFRTGKLRY